MTASLIETRPLARAVRRAARTSLALLALVACSLAGASPSDDPRVVARLECAAPAVEAFVLRGTVPLPAEGAPSFEGATEPFSVRLAGEKLLVPAQTEVVVRRPDGRPQVVEVLARVTRPEKARPGDRLRFDVVLAEHERADAPPVPVPVRELLDEALPPTIVLRSRDVYGNRYQVDLCGRADDPGFGSERILAHGAVERQRRVYGTLVPVGERSPQGAPLPHLMGAHAYLTEWARERFVSLDLRINNGATPGSRAALPVEETLGIVYWRELELVVPRGWLVLPDVHDPFWGTPYPEGDQVVFPVVKPYESGALHMMGPQAQFHRRLVVARDNVHALARAHLDGAGRAFCVQGPGLWSWFEPETAAFLAQRELLAMLDFVRRGRGGGTAAARMEDAGDADALAQVIRSGAPRGYGYVTAPVMGWAHPWFIRIEGGAGGEGIAMAEGYRAAGAASWDDLRRLIYLHRMNQSRQPEAQYDRFGDPVGYHEWLDERGHIPFDFRTNGRVVPPAFKLPAAYGPPPSKQVLDVVAKGLRPPYDRGEPHVKNGKLVGDNDVLIVWSPHDGQHMIRYTKQTKALVWLANDSLAKDDLLLSAELFRLMFHESPHDPADWAGGVTLKIADELARAHPHQGVWLNRDHAWGIDSMCAAYSTQTPEWRAENRSWFGRVADLFALAAMPSGLVERSHNTKILQTEKYDAAQAFECLFLYHAMRAMCASVFAGVDQARYEELTELAVRQCEYMFFGPIFMRFQPPYQPDPANPTIFCWGPRSGFGVALHDGYQTPPFSDAEHWGPNYMPADALKHDVDVNYVWQALAWAEEISREQHATGLENRYLRRSLACWLQYPSYEALLEALAASTSESSVELSKNWIGFYAKLRRLLAERESR